MMCLVREAGRIIARGQAERRGRAYRQHRRPAAHHSSTVLDCRIGTVNMKERSPWQGRRLGDEAGVAAYDLCTQWAAMGGLLDAVLWYEDLLEHMKARVAHHTVTAVRSLLLDAKEHAQDG